MLTSISATWEHCYLSTVHQHVCYLRALLSEQSYLWVLLTSLSATWEPCYMSILWYCSPVYLLLESPAIWVYSDIAHSLSVTWEPCYLSRPTSEYCSPACLLLESPAIWADLPLSTAHQLVCYLRALLSEHTLILLTSLSATCEPSIWAYSDTAHSLSVTWEPWYLSILWCCSPVCLLLENPAIWAYSDIAHILSTTWEPCYLSILWYCSPVCVTWEPCYLSRPTSEYCSPACLLLQSPVIWAHSDIAHIIAATWEPCYLSRPTSDTAHTMSVTWEPCYLSRPTSEYFSQHVCYLRALLSLWIHLLSKKIHLWVLLTAKICRQLI